MIELFTRMFEYVAIKNLKLLNNQYRVSKDQNIKLRICSHRNYLNAAIATISNRIYVKAVAVFGDELARILTTSIYNDYLKDIHLL